MLGGVFIWGFVANSAFVMAVQGLGASAALPYGSPGAGAVWASWSGELYSVFAVYCFLLMH